MARKTFEIAFELAGKINSSYGSMFASGNERLAQMNRGISSLKTSMKELERNQKTGTISAQEYANSHAKLTAQLEKAEKAQRRLATTTQLQKNINDTQKKIQSSIPQVPAAVAMGVSILAPAALMFNSLKKSMNFEAQMSSIQALTGLTGEAMQDVQKLAMEMGAKTKYSALEAAQGIEELLKAGLDPATVRAGGLEAALNLATAGGLELAAAAEIMSTALNAYKADGMKASDASNILAGTANASATSVEQLRLSLAAVSAVASGVGISFKDTNTALGLFANNGLKGSDAGTSLKTMLMNLEPTTDKQIALFGKLGLLTEKGTSAFFDANGKMKDMEGIAGLLEKSLANLNDEQRLAALDTMFGSDAIRAANIIYKEGAKGVKKFTEEMMKVTALDVAKKKMNNATGAVEQFSGALETLQISAMLPFLPTVKKLAEGAALITDKYSPAIIAAMERTAKKVEGFYDRLANNEAFQKMNWGDKVVFVLNEMMGAMDEWVSGDGGQQAEKVFTKLAEIAMRAWLAALGGMAKGSVDALAHGNITGGVALAMGASLLGGGMLLRGGLGIGRGVLKGGKWGAGKIDELYKNRTAARAAALETSNPLAASLVKATAGAGAAEGVAVASKGLAAISTVAKVAGKVAMPLAVASELYDISQSQNKAAAAAKAIGGLGGGVLGAKVGAAIGTAILPGIGTAIGAALGGIGGYVAGRYIGGAVSSDTSAPESKRVRRTLADISTYAYGGFANRPSIFGEAGLEVAIPMDGSARSMSLWEQAGRMLGAGTGGSGIIYAPIFNVNGGSDTEGAVRRAAKDSEDDFAKRFGAFAHQEGRLSYA